jgi:hypothetical protein
VAGTGHAGTVKDYTHRPGAGPGIPIAVKIAAPAPTGAACER